MRSRKALGALGGVALLCATSCMSGPNYCQRKVDDWQNADYVENPLRTAVITDVLPGYPMLKVIAFVPDFLFLNPVQFWSKDVWRAEGAAYTHDNPNDGHEPWFLGDDLDSH